MYAGGHMLLPILHLPPLLYAHDDILLYIITYIYEVVITVGRQLKMISLLCTCTAYHILSKAIYVKGTDLTALHDWF